MNSLTFSFSIFTSVCISISQCCGPKPRVHGTAITIRRISDGDDYLMFGSLLRDNIVITTPHYLYDADIKDVSVEANCKRITKKRSFSGYCIRRSVSKIIFENVNNTTKDFMNSIAIVILKIPFLIQQNSIRLIPFAEGIESLDTDECIHIKRYQTRHIKDIDTVIFYYRSFNKDAFDYQTKFGQTTLISKSAFDYPVFPELKNKTSLYNLILEQNHDLQITDNLDEKYLGTPIFCPERSESSRYFQIGIANYYFFVNSKTKDIEKSKKILYYINVVNRTHEILKIIRENPRVIQFS